MRAWVDGREHENEDVMSIEQCVISGNTFYYFLPWYFSNVNADNDLTMGLDFDNYELYNSTSLEF